MLDNWSGRLILSGRHSKRKSPWVIPGVLPLPHLPQGRAPVELPRSCSPTLKPSTSSASREPQRKSCTPRVHDGAVVETNEEEPRQQEQEQDRRRRRKTSHPRRGPVVRPPHTGTQNTAQVTVTTPTQGRNSSGGAIPKTTATGNRGYSQRKSTAPCPVTTPAVVKEPNTVS